MIQCKLLCMCVLLLAVLTMPVQCTEDGNTHFSMQCTEQDVDVLPVSY